MNMDLHNLAVHLRQVIEPYWTTRAGRDEDKTIMPKVFGGHALYCRKCETVDEVDGIFLTEDRVDHSRWLEVLAIGPNVGLPCSKKHREKFGRGKCMARPPMPGEMIYCGSDTSEGIKGSPLAPDEFFVEETVPLYMWVGEDEDDD